MAKSLPPLNSNTPIVDGGGRPKSGFMLLINQLLGASVANAVSGLAGKADKTITISAGTGLSGGGDLSADRSLALNATLGQLNDVDLTTPPTAGQTIVWDGTANKWKPGAGGGGGGGGPGSPAIPPTYVQSGSVIGNANPTVNLPAAPQDGNLLVAIGTHYNNSPAVQNGYTSLLITNGATNSGLMIAYKAASGDAAAQTPFSTGAAAQTLTVFEVAGWTDAPAIVNNFQESASATPALTGSVAQNSLVVGQFTQAQSSDPFTLSGDTTVAKENITGNPGTNGPYRVESFEYVPTNTAANVVATLSGAHNTYGAMLSIPGVPAVTAGGLNERVWVKPARADFTVLNGGASAVYDGGNGVVLSSKNVSSQIRFLQHTAALPTAPYSVVMRGAPVAGRSSGSYSTCLILRNSASGNILIFGNYQDRQFLLQRWSSYSAYNSNMAGPIASNRPLTWFRVNVKSTTIDFQTSCDGLNWYTLFTETISTYIANVNQVGVGCMVNGADVMDVFQSFEIGQSLP